MKTLKERQADRAARKLENRKQGGVDNTGTDRVGVLASAMAANFAEAESLSPEDQAELSNRLRNNMEPSQDYRPAETFPMSGIGVVNPFVVPTANLEAIAGGAQSGNGGGADPAEVSPADALAAAQSRAAWGTGTGADQSPPVDDAAEKTADETVNEDGTPKTKKDLMAILDSREPPVKYESDANHARLVELVKANPAPVAQAS